MQSQFWGWYPFFKKNCLVLTILLTFSEASPKAILKRTIPKYQHIILMPRPEKVKVTIFSKEFSAESANNCPFL